MDWGARRLRCEPIRRYNRITEFSNQPDQVVCFDDPIIAALYR